MTINLPIYDRAQTTVSSLHCGQVEKMLRPKRVAFGGLAGNTDTLPQCEQVTCTGPLAVGKSGRKRFRINRNRVFIPWLHIIAGLLLQTVLAASAYATITLPFSTTYDCAEQDQSTVGWVNCDGLAKNGDWTTSNGSKEQITTAANYSGGGGGRGQRHWIGDSGPIGPTPSSNGSGSIRYSFAPVSEIYIRYYVRFQQGLQLHIQSQAHKLIYTNLGYVDIKTSQFAFVNSGTGQSYTNSNTYGWNDLFAGQPNCSSICDADGQWHWFEMHLKTGNGNGVAQVWIDGALILNRSDVTISTSLTFDSFAIPENAGATTVNAQDMTEDIDDVAVRTTGPIGPLSGGGDVTNPVTTITGPTSSPTRSTSTSPETISGTCTDDTACTSVTWTCPTCSSTSGTATGTSSWSFSANYASGSNTITVTGHDAATNTHNDVLTVTYTPPGGGGTSTDGSVVYGGKMSVQ